MLESFTQGWHHSLRSFNDVVVINSKALQQASSQQAELYGKLLQGQVEYAQELAQQGDINNIAAHSSQYFSHLQKTLMAAGEEGLKLLQDTQQQVADSFKPALEVKAATKKTKPAAKKAAPKVADKTPKAEA